MRCSCHLFCCHGGNYTQYFVIVYAGDTYYCYLTVFLLRQMYLAFVDNIEQWLYWLYLPWEFQYLLKWTKADFFCSTISFSWGDVKHRLSIQNLKSNIFHLQKACVILNSYDIPPLGFSSQGLRWDFAGLLWNAACSHSAWRIITFWPVLCCVGIKMCEHSKY